MLLNRILSIVGEQFALNADRLSEDTTFEELGADDMDIADILLAVEGEFEIELGDAVENVENISDFVDLVEEALNKNI